MEGFNPPGNVESLTRDLEQSDLVFVYGTLQLGYGNNRCLTHYDAELVESEAVLEGQYYMTNVGFPYLADCSEFPSHAAKAHGEVWRVPSPSCLYGLDCLEGHPHHYTRELRETESGQLCWVYLVSLERCLMGNTCQTIDGAFKWRNY